MTHPALGRLRTKSAPDRSQLDRLHTLMPSWKVHWFPATSVQGEPKWVLAEHAPNAGDAFYREVGRWRLERLEAKEASRTSQQSDWFATDPIIPYGCELMMDGGIMLGLYDPDEAFSEQWWGEIEAMHRFTQDRKPLITKSEVDERYRTVSEEVQENDDYCAYWWDRVNQNPALKAEAEQLDAMAKEALDFYTKGRRHVVQSGA